AVLLYAIQQGRNFTTPIEGIATGEVGFAVKKGANPELIEMFNNGLAAIVKDGTYDRIINKYLDSNKSK
ncbi:transporter substrate-binding domain-containing protein, partial [Faecalimonas umbilicata]|nr:transporter substrate-binding domain-containing protein [Faecalimonas umbilicata]